MRGSTEDWAVILAAGDGSRLETLTGDDTERRPKQFWAPTGEGSMLSWSLGRAKRLVPDDHILSVVASKHERWWAEDLRELDPSNVFAQEDNRGTGVGLLLPLLSISRRSPGARVVVLPADHHVEYEWMLTNSLFDGLSFVSSHPHKVVLLGMELERPEDGLGWIVPGAALGDSSHEVHAFVEKPSPASGARLRNQGALVNSFIILGQVERLLDLYRLQEPDLVSELSAVMGEEGVWPGEPLPGWFSSLPHVDFSADILQQTTDRLSVLRVPSCGWTDLGTPSRVRRCFAGRSLAQLGWPEEGTSGGGRSRRRSTFSWLGSAAVAPDPDSLWRSQIWRPAREPLPRRGPQDETDRTIPPVDAAAKRRARW